MPTGGGKIAAATEELIYVYLRGGANAKLVGHSANGHQTRGFLKYIGTSNYGRVLISYFKKYFTAFAI